MKKAIALLLAAVLCFGLCACGGESSDDSFTLAENDYAFLDGLWYMEGDVSKATLEFVDQGDSSVWESRDENGDAVAAGRFTIVENNEVKLYDAAGEYQLSMIAQDENTLTMGESGTAYIRGTTLENTPASNEHIPDDAISDPVYIDTSSIAGEWYNEAVEMTLIIDDDGNFSLSNGSETTYGICEFDGTNITLSTDGDSIQGFLDSDGDIGFGEMDGYFVYSGALEPQPNAPEESSAIVVTDNSDGTQKITNSSIGVSCTCPSWMDFTDIISDALTISDGSDGYVVGRNINDYYLSYSGSDDEFIDEYINNYVFYDFALLYGESSDYTNYFILGDEGLSARINTSEINTIMTAMIFMSNASFIPPATAL